MKELREVLDEALGHSKVDELVTQKSVDDLIEELVEGLERAYNTPPDSVDRYYRIAGEVDLAENFRIIVRQDQELPFGRWYYQIQCHRKDVITGEWGEGFGGKAYLSPHASDNELVQTIFGLYKGYWEHEARESFMWRGRRVFGPHIASQALWEVARRVDIRSAKHVEDKPVDEEQQLAALRAKLSAPARSATFGVGDKVSWKTEGLNTNLVYGHVVDARYDNNDVQVKWVDGSGPTWHRMESLKKL